MNISRGVIRSAQRVVIYGVEGIGKSTLASHFPDPVFIDTEGSTARLDVARFDAPKSWAMLNNEVKYVISNPDCCKTLVVDTADWAEKLCISDILAEHKWDGIEDPGYGKGYVYVKEKFGSLLNQLTEVMTKGVNVVLTAHAQITKFEQPDELGAYDRWSLKLSKQTAPLVKEWCDMLLFCNYKTMVVNVDGRGAVKGKNKAQGGTVRVMYTQHTASWDAKNRSGLPPEIPMDYESIRNVIETKAEECPAPTVPENNAGKTTEISVTDMNAPETASESETIEKSAKTVENEPKNASKQEVKAEQTTEVKDLLIDSDPKKLPPKLIQLMQANHIGEWAIEAAVASKGYYPSDMKIEDYDPDFIDGVLIGAWDQVSKLAKAFADKDYVPFD